MTPLSVFAGRTVECAIACGDKTYRHMGGSRNWGGGGAGVGWGPDNF